MSARLTAASDIEASGLSRDLGSVKPGSGAFGCPKLCYGLGRNTQDVGAHAARSVTPEITETPEDQHVRFRCLLAVLRPSVPGQGLRRGGGLRALVDRAISPRR